MLISTRKSVGSERDPDESHGTFPYKNVHMVNTFCLISKESYGPVEVRPYSSTG